MATLTQSTDPAQKSAVVESVRPVIHDFHHQDSVFGNSFQAKSNFIVHPDWNSEGVNAPVCTPLDRPPWSWEQPRYRQNVQYPITYSTPEYSKVEEKKMKSPTLPYQPPKMVSFQNPEYENSTGVPGDSNNDIPECFRHSGTEPATPYQHATTMEERQRIQWHLHY